MLCSCRVKSIAGAMASMAGSGNGQLCTPSQPIGFSPSAVQVEGVGGVGILSGVSSLVGGGGAYCALLTSGEVNCWGWGPYGQLLAAGYFHQPRPSSRLRAWASASLGGGAIIGDPASSLASAGWIVGDGQYGHWSTASLPDERPRV